MTDSNTPQTPVRRSRADRTRLVEQLREANERLVIATLQAQEETERAEVLAEAERQSRLDAEEAQRQIALLSEAGRALASSLDYEATLDRVAHLAVPDMADWCVVDLLVEGAMQWGVATAHVDPARETEIREVRRRLPPDPEAFPAYAEFLRGGTTMLVADVDETRLTEVALGPEDLRLLHELGPRSQVTVRLEARDRTLGSVSFLTSVSGRRYGAEDLPVLEELARRAAMAIDNALLYREAHEANAAKDRFVAMVSHELRSPLSTILAGTELLKRVLPADEKVRRTLTTIERSAQLQARLVEDLLDLSRMTRGTLQLERVPVLLDSLAAAAVQSLQGEVERAGLTLSLDLEPDLWVCGDADRLHQVVSNLLTNAIKFTPSGGSIRIACAAHGTRHGRIVVEDTGIGLDEDLLPHLFEMFRQADTSGERKAGLGIGLALVKGIVDAHGGRIWAESEGVGKGSRFTVELPLLSEAAALDGRAFPSLNEAEALVLRTLRDLGEATVPEIARHTKMQPEDLEQVLGRLMALNYALEVDSGNGIAYRPIAQALGNAAPLR